MAGPERAGCGLIEGKATCRTSVAFTRSGQRLGERLAMRLLRFNPASVFVAICVAGAGISVGSQASAQGRGGRNWDPGRFLNELDKNHDGMIAPDEIQGRARYMIAGAARGAGLDTTKPIPLADLQKAMENAGREYRQRGQNGGGPRGADGERSSGPSD